MAKASLILLFLVLSLSISHSEIIKTNNTVFSGVYNITPFFLLHNSDYGGGISVSKLNTNNIGVGAAFAVINEKNKLSFYNATISLKCGKEFNLINTNYPIFVYLESGASLDALHPSTLYSQSIVGFNVSKSICKQSRLYLGGGVGRNSKWGNDLFYIFTTSVTF